MIYCRNCGRYSPDDAHLCAYCGFELLIEDKEQARTKLRKKQNEKYIGALIAIFIIIAVIYMSSKSFNFGGKGDDDTLRVYLVNNSPYGCSFNTYFMVDYTGIPMWSENNYVEAYESEYVRMGFTMDPLEYVRITVTGFGTISDDYTITSLDKARGCNRLNVYYTGYSIDFEMIC